VEDSLLGLNVNLNISKYKADWAQEDVNEASAVLDLVAKRFLRLRGVGEVPAVFQISNNPKVDPSIQTGDALLTFGEQDKRGIPGATSQSPEPDRELKLRDALHGRMGRKGGQASAQSRPYPLTLIPDLLLEANRQDSCAYSGLAQESNAQQKIDWIRR
jgi:hypothetical protein